MKRNILIAILTTIIWSSAHHLIAQQITGFGFIIEPSSYILTNFRVVVASEQLVAVPLSGLGREAGVHVLMSYGRINGVRKGRRIPRFQIDANINPGNTGGPVLNDRGGVIEIAAAKLDAPKLVQESEVVPGRINYAVSIDKAGDLTHRACPFGVPQAKRSKLDLTQIDKEVWKATVLIIAENSGASPSDFNPAVSAPTQPLQATELPDSHPSIFLCGVTNNLLALDDTPENRANIAEEYLRVVPTQEVMADLAEKLALNLPAPDRELFKSLLSKYLDFNAVREANKQALIKFFTADELQAMRDFYGTPQGKSILKKMGSYMGDLMPTMQLQVAKAMQAALREMKMAHDNQ
jgi:hypothetical protein